MRGPVQCSPLVLLHVCAQASLCNVGDLYVAAHVDLQRLYIHYQWRERLRLCQGADVQQLCFLYTRRSESAVSESVHSPPNSSKFICVAVYADETISIRIRGWVYACLCVYVRMHVHIYIYVQNHRRAAELLSQ
jgi:hypothetical protein